MKKNKSPASVLVLLAALVLFAQLGHAAETEAKKPKPLTTAQQIAILQSQVASLQSSLRNVTNFVNELSPFITVDLSEPKQDGLNGPRVIFSGANVQIVSGSGSTNDGGGALVGLGNLVIGYNENSAQVGGSSFSNAGGRTGSHNLIIGDVHKYPSYGGLVAGVENQITAPYSSVSGGSDNQATGAFSSVSGGPGNISSATDGWAGGTFHTP